MGKKYFSVFAGISILGSLFLGGCPAGSGPTTPSGPTRTATSTRTLTPTASLTASPTLTNSSTPILTSTATSTRTLTGTLTDSPTPTISFTPTDTRTVTNTPTVTLSPTITLTPTITLSPTITNTRTQTSTFTITPTLTQTGTPTLRFTVVPCSTSQTVGFSYNPTVPAYITYYGSLDVVRIDLPATSNVTNLQVACTLSGTPIQMGIYRDNGADYPGQLIYLTGQQTGVQGVNSFNVSPAFSLPAGIYWLGFYGDGLGGVNADGMGGGYFYRIYSDFASNPVFPPSVSPMSIVGNTASRMSICHNGITLTPTRTLTPTQTPTPTFTTTFTRTSTSTATPTFTSCPITLVPSPATSSGTGTWTDSVVVSYTNVTDWTAAASANGAGVNLTDQQGGVLAFSDDPGYAAPATVPVTVRVIYTKNNSNMRLVWDLNFTDSNTASSFGGPVTETTCCTGPVTFDLGFTGGNALTLSQINQMRILLKSIYVAGSGGNRDIDIDAVQILYEPCQP